MGPIDAGVVGGGFKSQRRLRLRHDRRAQGLGRRGLGQLLQQLREFAPPLQKGVERFVIAVIVIRWIHGLTPCAVELSNCWRSLRMA